MKIRHSVFETNSSSTHAIVIKWLPSIKDLVNVNFWEYWWEWNTMEGAQQKAEYLYTYILNYKKDKLKLFKKTLEDYVWHSINFEKKRLNESWYIDHWDDYDFDITKENILDIVFGDGYIKTWNDNDECELWLDWEKKVFYKGN